MRRLCLALAISATTLLVPSWCNADDQAIAQQIAGVMKQAGVLSRGDDVSVRYKEGTAYLRGTVHDEQQATTAIEIAQASPYVERVVNEIQISADGAPKASIRPTNIAPKGSTASPKALSNRPTTILTAMNEQDDSDEEAVETAVPHSRIRQASVSGDARVSPQPLIAARAEMPEQQPMMRQPAPRQMGMPMPAAPSRLAQLPPPAMMNQGAGRMAGPGQMGPGSMPQPAYAPGTGGGVSRAAYDQPAMPGYAWPSYAAYPNYAALTYPKQYSPTAWPYIGPFYPYPQVPMGWRKVSLQWQDGWWFLDFKD